MLLKKYNKKSYFSLILIVVSLFSFIIAPAATPVSAQAYFTDVPNEHWASQYIIRLASPSLNIIMGMGDGTFGVDLNATRAEFATFMDRVLMANTSIPYQGIFSDVSADRWYTKYVEAAFDAGIIRGTGNGLFEPEANITRQEVTTIIANMIALNENTTVAGLADGYTLSVSDTDFVSEWALDGLKVCYKFGITNGYNDGSFGPQGMITRAETAKVISTYSDYFYKIYKNYTNDVTVKIGWANYGVDMSKDLLGRGIQEKFRCEFDTIIVPDEKVILLAAQDQLPDLFRLTLGSSAFMQLDRKDNHFLYHINHTTVDQYPLLKNYISIDQSLNEYSDNSYDKQYVGLPFLNSSLYPAAGVQASLYYRKDWAAKVGYDINIDTVDKSYQLMKRFRENDPDGNGFIDTYGFTGYLNNLNYIPWIDINSWVRENDPVSEFYGLYVPGYVNTRMFDAITWWNRLLKEQIMPADFNLQQNMAQFIANQAGVSYGKSSDYWMWEFMMNRFDPAHQNYYPTLPRINGRIQTVDDVVSEFVPLKLTDNSTPRFPSQLETTITAISSKAGADSVKTERILDFYEWSMTNEGSSLLNYGILGRDYYIDSDGKAVRTLPESTTTPGTMKKIWEVYQAVEISKLVANVIENPIPEKSSIYPEWIASRTKETQAVKDEYAVVPTTTVNNIMTPTKINHLDAYDYRWYEDKLNRIIAQDAGKSIEQGWTDFLNEFFITKEGRQVVQEVNAEMRAKGLVGQQ